jgi:sodium-dependent dicarboxylate transporter 2/3/5
VLPVDWPARRFTVGWSEASRIDWGTLLLFGGGLVLGGAMFRTGLAAALGGGLVELTGSRSLGGLTFAILARRAGPDRDDLEHGARHHARAARDRHRAAAGVSPSSRDRRRAVFSMAFMLLVSTPPNAIVTARLRSSGACCATGRCSTWRARSSYQGVLVMCRLLGLA